MINYKNHVVVLFIPRSNVIPLSLLWGFLSNAAVDCTVLSALAVDKRWYEHTHTCTHTHTYLPKAVLPLSICPRTPTLKLRVVLVVHLVLVAELVAAMLSALAQYTSPWHSPYTSAGQSTKSQAAAAAWPATVCMGGSVRLDQGSHGGQTGWVCIHRLYVRDHMLHTHTHPLYCTAVHAWLYGLHTNRVWQATPPLPPPSPPVLWWSCLLSVVHSEANARRIAIVEQCFGAGGSVSVCMCVCVCVCACVCVVLISTLCTVAEVLGGA